MKYEDCKAVLREYQAEQKRFADELASNESIFYKKFDDVAPENILQTILDRYKGKVVLVDIWATWCGPCKGELRELGDINRRVQEEDGAIIGILSDADDAETIALGKELLTENGADYLNLTLPAALNELGIIGGYPTSIFVDSNGVILAPPINGAVVSLYETRFSELLEGKQPAAVDAGAKDASADTAENSGGAYRVIVQDQDGNPVQGVTVQFCSEAECVLGKTDADGAASFDMPEGPGHEIHLLKVPEGFEKDGTTYSAPETYGDIVLVLNKAA
jgi:thiol-disulfide isomerase/thioredoxin